MEQRSSLARSLVGSERAWNSSKDTGTEYNRHYSESKRPLEGNNLGEELSINVISIALLHLINTDSPNTQTSSKERSRKSNIVVTECQQEEPGKRSKSPNSYICKDSADEGVAVNHNGTVPQKHKEGKGQRHSRDCIVDQSRCGVVAEVYCCQLEEVDDQDHLGKDGVTTSPEHNPSKVKNIVTGDVSGVIT